MNQLRATKTGLAVCAAACISLFLYLRTPTPQEAERAPTPPPVADCGFYPDELCAALFEGKVAAPKVAKFCQWPPGMDIAGHLRAPPNCSRVSRGLRFITRPLSAEEANSSLAYIVGAQEPATLVRLLRAIYTPQNLYCVHVAEAAPAQYQAAVQVLAGCFQNILSSRSETAAPGPARLQADLGCMRRLLRSGGHWSHAINVRGDDFPLRTNREIVRYLRARWKDKNITPGAVWARAQPQATPPQVGFEAAPPHNLTVYLGSGHYVLTRQFVEFVLSDPRARALLLWCGRVRSPERYYWVTLNRLADAPGATPDAGWEGNIRATKQKGQEGRGHSGCTGPQVQASCAYGLRDLPWIGRSSSLFANSLEPLAEPLLVTCLERRHRLRVLRGAEVPLEPHWHFQHQTHFGQDLSG